MWTKILYLHRERHRDINHYRIHQPEIDQTELKVYIIVLMLQSDCTHLKKYIYIFLILFMSPRIKTVMSEADMNDVLIQDDVGLQKSDTSSSRRLRKIY